MPQKIAIFASGNGSNAEHIVRHFADSPLARVELVLTNRPAAGVIERMKPLGITVSYVANDVWDNCPGAVVELLRGNDISLVALAGFMHYVSPVILNAFPNRVLNIHPSLLPAYGGKGMWGRRVHEAVIAAGESVSGATVHIVSDVMDEGEIVAQLSVDVLPDDTPDTLSQRVHLAEYAIYPLAIERLLGH